MQTTDHVSVRCKFVVHYVHSSITRLPNATFGFSFARKGRLLPYKTRTDDHKSRARDDKTAGPAATWIIGYAACERQQETHTGLLLLCCWKNRRSPRILSSSLCLSLFFPEVALPTFPNRRGCVFPLSFILFYFISFSRCQEHDMIGNIDYL